MTGMEAPMPAHPTRHLGQQLERARLDRGISQDEAAEQLGVSQATFSRWVQGINPKSAHWTKIARFLKIPRAEVVEMVSGARLADPVDERMHQLEGRFDRLESKVDRVLSALDPEGPRARRRAR
jgi:transcriptional regulator with XRE-family HTH domain